MTDEDSPGDEPTGASNGADRPVSDGGVSAGLDDDELYEVVHDAVEDAILGVVGTLLLLGIGFVSLVSGVTAVVDATSTASFGIGLAVLAAGLVIFVTTLRGVLPVSRWI
ncbi:hypothetical protein HZS55_05275 [Halosimplex rubrum]|uniref:Uncharacterized protein n=1 Tax=Halosimplex rubrum TaxID=869889 RepID=A0A7D5T4A7_9EURY|nr:hypothetical protein [Halosimplex rubrum]QLH76749.1 hypothetical protein HZS55_05275 [Halosimplex rubrum]